MQEPSSRQGAPVRLRCEYLVDPIGVDVIRPRLSWWVGDHRPAELQTAYQLLAASHPDLLAMNEGDLWDPGRVEGRDTTQVEYQGKPLVSARAVWWKVRSFDSDGLPSPWSAPARFEAGLLAPDDWQGRWIRAGLVGSRVATVPVPLFGRRFELTGPVRRARLYVAVRGQVALQLNGQALDPGALAPNWVDFDRRAEYLTYDVGSLLQSGGNDLAVLLADGWYAGDPGSGRRQQYGDRPELLVQLNVVLEDGRHFQLASDGDWRWQPSWILASDPTRGEQVDGVRRRETWLDDGPDAFGWYPVELGDGAGEGLVLPTAAGPVARAHDKPINGKLVRWQADLCRALFEFPEPVLGRARLALTAPDGGALRIRYGLDRDGRGEIVGASEDVCVAAGEEKGESFEALFSLHGFRFVEVSGDVYREDAISVEALPVAQQVDIAAHIAADHPRINQLFDLMVGQLRRAQCAVGMAGLQPVDRRGELAVTGAGVGAMLLTLDSVPLVVRWLANMADAQFPEGAFPAVVPAPPGEEALCGEGPAGASAAFVEGLWHVYRLVGDRSLLRRYFPAIKQMLAGALAATTSLVREDLEADPAYPADLAATAWLYRSARLASRLAGVLGNLSDLEDCEEIADNVRNAFRRRFVTPDGRVVGDSAAVYALTLGFGLLDRSETLRARQALIRRVEAGLTADDGRSQALLATPWLLAVLTEQGRLDLAYRLVLEPPFRVEPSLGGRDLLGLVGAGVLEWLFGVLSGIAPARDLSQSQVGFRHVLVQPRPPLGLPGASASGEPPVRNAETSLETANGRYASSWEITDEAFELELLVPGNCSADVVLPDGTRHAVDAGSHHFRMLFDAAGDGIPVLREVS
jgi:alpha-L-rhamnosidase